MNAPELLAAGLMSGTSLDGITAAIAGIREPAAGEFQVRLLGHATQPFTPEHHARVAAAIGGGGPRDLARLHADLSRWSVDAVLAACGLAGIGPTRLTFVASHGQTVWHEPPHTTLQLGSPAWLVERLGVPVISDFRARDVAAGGQGAPLVPRADRLLFAAPDAPRVLLNLGGIANLTAVPPRGADGPLLAFDTGPGVMVMDACARLLVPGRRYDDGGALAAAGRVLEPVLAEVLRQPWFSLPAPRSTGREQFGETFARGFVARCLELSAAPEDVLATATALTARAIGRAAALIPAALRPADVVRSGGGARNGALVRAIAEAWPGPVHRDFGELFFDGEAKEAVAFALLGYLTWTSRSGNEPSATGAAGPRVLGSITHP